MTRMTRKAEINAVESLCEAIGYGNVMDITSALWSIKNGEPMHVPSVFEFMTEEGKTVAKQNLSAREKEIKLVKESV